MRIAVMGRAASAGYFGARLAQAGHDVTFVARGAHLAALARTRPRDRERRRATRHHRHGDVDRRPGAIAPVDVAMFCVKLWDVEAAARADRAAACAAAAS